MGIKRVGPCREWPVLAASRAGGHETNVCKWAHGSFSLAGRCDHTHGLTTPTPAIAPIANVRYIAVHGGVLLGIALDRTGW